jgi:hypothetical protein
MHEPSLCRQLGKDQRRRRYGELDQSVGSLQQGCNIAGHRNAVTAEPRQFAGVAADHC